MKKIECYKSFINSKIILPINLCFIQEISIKQYQLPVEIKNNLIKSSIKYRVAYYKPLDIL